ncbi:1,4-alpha-glucan branching protein GlgB [Candidatus Parabeggiatoa sp. HSG14]|uniref:1,4-alpha-glucan branching protein GlgB n=1 Tax=Candidatus Parabeggiatoa sp. HSG14 TaxID=3055593 RepID=UPI0025A71BEA|nr:1,4-alpha-glucan branching protein GlgB [Thiotrichales bacterium HSG14]
MPISAQQLNSDLQKIVDARHHDPFAVLGKHPSGKLEVVRTFMPAVTEIRIMPGNLPMKRIPNTDLFEWQGKAGIIPQYYQFKWNDVDGNTHKIYDSYSFPPQLSDFDLHLFSEGKHWHAYRFFGAHLHTVNDISGVLFAVWAPNAERISVVGEFNRWDGRCHPMRGRGSSGVWELFIPGIGSSALYKFEIRNRDSGNIYLKSDPYGQGFEHRPQTSTYVAAAQGHPWQDEKWLQKRTQHDWLKMPMSVYEVHLGSWMRDIDGNFLNYRQLAEKLVDYVINLGFTHIELLPIAEHPLDASWGYQVIGFFAPTSRFGSQDDFRYFVDYCHQHNIGVLLDWVPGHFPKDAHGLAWFDGTALYEYADPRQGEHRDWGTLIFNYGRHEVKSFLISNAVYWLEEYHIDGLRVDAVASMLYLDYSRNEGEWVPNMYGGNENLDAIAFLRELNTVTHKEHPGTLMIAEESTSWPQVTRPTWLGGLGFSMKWNMGWMHDTLEYISKEPIHRFYHHQHLTFGMLYAFSENFILPFSHDEVVHGKHSLLDKMPGDSWQRFANLRLLYTYMWTYPGKKLLFMGDEFAHGREWNCAESLDWHLLNLDVHTGIQTLIKDLNQLYQQLPTLHYYDFEARGFMWIDCHDSAQSIISYMRCHDDDEVVIILNFTPVPRHDYRIGVTKSGLYQEIFNSDSHYYGGSDVGNVLVMTNEIEWMGQPYSLNLTLPPLAGIILKLKEVMPATESTEVEAPIEVHEVAETTETSKRFKRTPKKKLIQRVNKK